MRILVFSDSHRDVDACAAVIENIIGVDAVFHCGDHAADCEELARRFPELDFKYVCGNCDFSSAPGDLTVEVSGKKIFLTHGHGYGVKSGYGEIKSRGKAENADLVVFGHTHVPLCDLSSVPPLLNPGSIRHGRTYAVIEIEDGVLKACICEC